jgi:hypothetical protein
MSRSNPTLTNPAEHFMSWSGSTGTLNWYNKEQEKNIPVKLPFQFLVLDQLATIKGYNKQLATGFWSNEVRNTRKEELTVRSKQGVVYTGFYKNEQGVVQVPKGADYTQSVYIAHKIGDKYVLGNINMKGSSRSAWFDFANTCKPENGTVVMDIGEKQTAQTGDFYPPVFTYQPSTDEENTEAVRLDKELQIYLNQYLAAQKQDEEERIEHTFSHDGDTSDVGKATPEQVADYNARKNGRVEHTVEPQSDDWAQDKYKQITQQELEDDTPPKKPDVVIDHITDEPINLDDIPF